MATKAEQSERTRAALVAAGRRLFAENGFAATSTEDLVRAAGVTRGALYHHFDDKRELFAAVYEDVERSLVEDVIKRADQGATDPIDALRRGAAAFLDACLDPVVARIALLEAPTVLGWERWREIDARYGLGLVKGALQAAVESGALRPLPADALGHILFGGLVEAALLLAASPKPRKTRREVGDAIDAILTGLASPAFRD